MIFILPYYFIVVLFISIESLSSVLKSACKLTEVIEWIKILESWVDVGLYKIRCIGNSGWLKALSFYKSISWHLHLPSFDWRNQTCFIILEFVNFCLLLGCLAMFRRKLLKGVVSINKSLKKNLSFVVLRFADRHFINLSNQWL